VDAPHFFDPQLPARDTQRAQLIREPIAELRQLLEAPRVFLGSQGGLLAEGEAPP
jgi:hypothetical protein